MNKTHKISVIIATYNRSKLLRRAVASVFAQNYENIELIIIDDASTDNTKNILGELKSKYGKQITTLTNKVNKGISYNSNLGFSVSTGDYIALLGDDDFWSSTNKLSKQLEIFKKNKNIGIVGSSWKEQSLTEIRVKKPRTGKDRIKLVLEGGSVICGSTALISKIAWQHVKGFDESKSKGTDSDLFRRIILSGYDYKNLSEVTTVVDVGHGNRMTPFNSKKDYLNALKNQIHFIESHKSFITKYPLVFLKRFVKTVKFFLIFITKK